MTTRVGSTACARTIIGYCWPWTVRSGEQVDFMVSCERAGAYDAALVRIICADNLTNPAMFKEEEVAAAFNGRHAARAQATHVGSYVEIIPRPLLDELSSFTVQAMVYPTLLPGGVRIRSGGPANSWEDPECRDQHVVSRWDSSQSRGWALLVDRQGRTAFMFGDGEQVYRTELDTPLVQDKWFLISGGIDTGSRTLHVSARASACSPGDRVAWPERRKERVCSAIDYQSQAGPLRFAAGADGPGNASRLKPAFCFNGRLDRVRLTRGTLTSEETLELAGAAIPETLRSKTVGFWDFGIDIAKTRITDLSENALHGVTINAPTRGVRGVGWDGSTNDWRQRPDHYSAIHFHDDDLYDAEWSTDFSFRVPDDLPSGIYAARVRQGGSEDYMPFFVAPPRGEARAPVALLIPTASYTAYSNITGLTALKRKRQVDDRSDNPVLVEEDLHPSLLQNAADADFVIAHLRELGKGIYANHADGTLATCASQRHPNMTTKPKGINWTLVADTYITDWLERRMIPYDIITDDLLHREGVELLQRYSVVMTGNHPEYYTRRMRDAVECYQEFGGRLMYLGGNGFWWVTSFHSELPGLVEVRKDKYAGAPAPYEMRHAFDGVDGGLWERCGRPSASLVGVTYGARGYAMEGSAPYRRLSDSLLPRAAFIFEGVANETFGDYGLLGGGAAGLEVDAITVERGTPAHALHLARADRFPRYGSMIAEEYKAHAVGPVADLVFFETPNGGAVFSVGSMAWVGALSHNAYENDVSRITENVLRRFLRKQAFILDGSATTTDAGRRSVAVAGA
jgi:N,N-dimethylformamidase